MTPPILRDLPDAFETERLLIRAPRPGDGAAVHAALLESFANLRHWMPWARERPTPEAQEQWARQAHAVTAYAFTALGARRVEARVDPANVRSRAVLERCAFRLEGTLRNHLVANDGTVRDTLVFSRIPGDGPHPPAGRRRPAGRTPPRAPRA